VVLIKAYGPLVSPVLGGLDTWSWVAMAREFLSTGRIDPWFYATGYPPTHMLVLAAVGSLGTDLYDVVRYWPILSALSVVPIYLLVLEVFESRTVAAGSALLTVTSRWHFMRNSIGTPEVLSHLLLGFGLYFLLKSLKTDQTKHRLCATGFMATAALYNHFTIIVLAAALPALFLFARFKSSRVDLKTFATVLGPVVLIAGFAWYFWVLGPITETYFVAKLYEPAPVELSVLGLAKTLAYSVGKLGVRAFTLLGYAMTLLCVLGFFLARKAKVMAAYLIGLAVLAFGLEFWYNLSGTAGTTMTRLYIFSWVAMPVAAFASKACERIRFPKLTPLLLIGLVCTLNLASANYWKASSGFSESHYYPKLLSDEEYYALEYLNERTPKESLILTVGVGEGTLTMYATVAQRTIITIGTRSSDLVDLVIVYSDLRTENGSARTANGDSLGPLRWIALTHNGPVYFLCNPSFPIEKLQVPNECVYRNQRIVVYQLYSPSGNLRRGPDWS